MDLDDALRALYALPPESFIAEREALARGLRTSGDDDLAGQVHALRRPTVSAWAVNMLAREHAGDVAELTGLGDELRTAQASGAGDRIRALSARRQELITRLGRLAADTAAGRGQRLSPAAREEVHETLTAALASTEAAGAVTSGVLTRALSYAGFGDVDVASATAAPVPARRPSPPGESARARRAEERAARAREGDAREAAARAREAQARATVAERAVERLRKGREAAAARVTKLRGQLRDAEAELEQAGRDLDAATRSLREAHEEVRAAHTAVRQ